MLGRVRIAVLAIKGTKSFTDEASTGTKESARFAVFYAKPGTKDACIPMELFPQDIRHSFGFHKGFVFNFVKG